MVDVMEYQSSLSAQQIAYIQQQMQAAIDDCDDRKFAECEAIIRATRKPDLAAWGKKYLPHYFSVAPSKLHRELGRMCNMYVDSRSNKNAIIAPRGGAKTTWISKTFPLFTVCEKLEHYILLVGDTTEQAQQNLESIKHELVDNDELAKAYPDACGEGPVWNQDQIVTRNKVKIQALGAGKKFRGRSFRNHRPGLIVVDDLDDDEAVMSDVQRRKMWSWFSKVLVPMGTASTNFLVVGTALHREDTLHRLKKTANWQFQLFKGLISEPVRDDLWKQWQLIYCNFDIPVKERQKKAREFYIANEAEMLRGADVLWPEREPLYALMEYRIAYGEAAFLSEYQGVPTADQDAEWPRETFEESDGAPLYFHQWPQTKLRVIALDPSKGKTDASDFSAFVMLGLGVDGLLYVDANLARRDSTRIVDDGFTIASQFQPHAFGIEINQFQELLAVEFQRQAAERGTILPLVQINNLVKKETRIRLLGPYLRTRQFRFRSNSAGADELLNQLQSFPNGSHDDGPDALQMALSTLESLLRAENEQPIEEETWMA